MNSSKAEILGQTSRYLIGTALTQFISAAATILTRRFLGPVQMGVWALLQVVVKYSSYSTIGTTAATQREIPFWLGKGDKKKAEAIKDTFFTYGVASSAVIAAFLCLGALFFKERLRTELYWGLLIVSAMIVLQRLNNILITLLRATKNFKLASKQMVVSAVVNAVLITALAYYFRIYGYILGMCASFLFNIFYMLCSEPFHLKWHLDTKELKALALYGMPLLILGLVNTAFMSIDRFMIAGLLGLRELGLYGIALLASSYAAQFPNAVSVVLIPNFHERFGRSEDPSSLKNFTLKSADVFCDTMPALIGGGWFFCDWAVRWALPEFSEGITALKYLLLSSFFLAIQQPYYTFMIAVKRHWILVPVLLAVCLAAFGLNWTFIRAGWGICGIALAASFILFLKFSLNYFLAAGQLYSKGEALRHFMSLAGKFLVMCVLLFILDRIPGIGKGLWGSTLRYAVFLLAYTPSLLKFAKDYGLNLPLFRVHGR
jgi:O-antigen/teichoic acid export membrane protein